MYSPKTETILPIRQKVRKKRSTISPSKVLNSILNIGIFTKFRVINKLFKIPICREIEINLIS